MERRGIPAGTALGIGLVALAVAALLNADALVADAERKPFGPARDRSLAVWRPVEAVADALGLTQPRRLAAEAMGRDPLDDDPVPIVTLATTTTAPVATTTTFAPPRPPAVEDPVAVYVGGDSMAQVFGQSLVRLLGDTEGTDPTLDYRISSGLARPDFFDWPAHLAEIDRTLDPEVMVLVFGANDGQGLITPSGEIYQPGEAGWVGEYRRRVGETMDLVRRSGRLVLWVGQPQAADSGFSATLETIGTIYADEASVREGVVFLDARVPLSGPDGSYREVLVAEDGSLEDLRQGDGFHLTRAGGDRLARYVLDRLVDAVGSVP